MIQPVVQRRGDRHNPRRSPPAALALRPVGRRTQAMISGAKGWRWPHDPQRSGLAARSAVAAVTVSVTPHLAQRMGHEWGNGSSVPMGHRATWNAEK
jgi:hypothetical protein